MPVKRKAKKSKAVAVREHPRRVPVSNNPGGITTVDRHLRHVAGQYMDKSLIQSTFNNYDKKKLKYPSKGKLNLPNEDKYDDYIAVWTDNSMQKEFLSGPQLPTKSFNFIKKSWATNQKPETES